MALYRSDKFTESMQTVVTAEYEGQPCYKVHIGWKSGRESSDCYSKDSGFLVAQEFTVDSPMGSVDTVIVFSDYKTFEGDGVEIMLPTSTNVSTMGQQQQLIIDTLELGTPGDEYFELPPAIVTLMETETAE